MKVIYRICVLLVGCSIMSAVVASGAGLSETNWSALPEMELSRDFPLGFHPNRGQTDPIVDFLYRSGNYAVFFTRTEIVISLRGSSAGDSSVVTAEVSNSAENEKPPAVFRLRFEGASPNVQISGREEMRGTVNYLVGHPSQWRTNIPTYRQVKYKGLYPGIDVIFYGNQGELEFDFVVAPGADLNQIEMLVQGADDVTSGGNGELLIEVNEKTIQLSLPVIYQEDKLSNGTGTLAGSYRIEDRSKISFCIDEYDQSKPLVIDPILVLSSYLGGSGGDDGHAIALGAEGNIYLAGGTISDDFPTDSGIIDSSQGGPDDAFITKVRADNAEIIYSSYLGGNSIDVAFGLAVDSMGQAYLTGRTRSTDFPMVNALQPIFGGGDVFNIDAFVAKLDPSGSGLIYSTYLGGTASSQGSGDDLGQDIAVDTEGNAYVVGFTGAEDFPTATPLQSAFAGVLDAFVTKIDPSGSALIYSTYLGGNSVEEGRGIAVGPNGDAFVVGVTDSTDFPIASAAQADPGGFGDTFIARLSSNGSLLVYSTYLGGEFSDVGTDIAIDDSQNAYIAGETGGGFPVLNGFQSQFGGGTDAFVAKLGGSGALIYSTYLGGVSGEEQPMSIGVDTLGRATVGGGTLSRDFPLFKALQNEFGGGAFDGFLAQLDESGANLIFSTFLGGSSSDHVRAVAVAQDRSIYLTGTTASADFPTVGSVAFGGGTDAFITKLAETIPIYFAQFGNGGGFKSDLVLTNTSQSETVSGRVDFFDDQGSPLPVGLLNFENNSMAIANARPLETVSGFEFNIAPLGALTVSTDGLGDLAVGSAVAVSDFELGGVVRFTIPEIGIAGVGASEGFEQLITPVRRETGGINTGIALHNTEAVAVTLRLTLRNTEGEEVASGSRTLEDFPGQGHLAQFIDELFPDADLDNFEGTLLVEVIGGRVAATALELGTEPGQFTTLPVSRVR